MKFFGLPTPSHVSLMLSSRPIMALPLAFPQFILQTPNFPLQKAVPWTSAENSSAFLHVSALCPHLFYFINCTIFVPKSRQVYLQPPLHCSPYFPHKLNLQIIIFEVQYSRLGNELCHSHEQLNFKQCKNYT